MYGMMMHGCLFIDGMFYQLMQNDYDACYHDVAQVCELKGRPLRDDMFDICRKHGSGGDEFTRITVVGETALQQALNNGHLLPGDVYPNKPGYTLDEAYQPICAGRPGEDFPDRPGFVLMTCASL
jgi:hypothetical protein